MLVAMPDVCSRQDIALVVDTFYSKATEDETIGYLFEGLDLLKHLPTLHDFWENMLFRTGKYKGGMMYKHFALNARKPLELKHFERWLELFTQTIDEHFSGDNANRMKQFANSIASTMQERILQVPEVPITFRSSV
ncbi:MAG: group III truncated hemoglobin [Trueperaceae bacterium]